MNRGWKPRLSVVQQNLHVAAGVPYIGSYIWAYVSETTGEIAYISLCIFTVYIGGCIGYI